jgi:hypothetical protein
MFAVRKPQASRVEMRPSAVVGSPGNPYANPRAHVIAHHHGGSSDKAYAASGRHVYDDQIIRRK